jgi:chromosome segregation ATPase
MTIVRSLVGKLVRFVSWLCYGHQWAEWELFTIALAALALLWLTIRQLRKGTVAGREAEHLRAHSPVIGINLADPRRSRRSIRTQSKKRFAHALQERQQRQNAKRATRKIEHLNEQLIQLQREVAEHRQTETSLKEQLTGLTAANEKLRQEVAESRQAEQRLRQQAAELTAANERLVVHSDGPKQLEEVAAKDAEQRSRRKTGKMPLSIEELTQVSDLAKRVSSRMQKRGAETTSE